MTPDEAHTVRIDTLEEGVKSLWSAKASQREVDGHALDIRALEEGRATRAEIAEVKQMITKVEGKIDALQGKIVGAAITMAGSAVLIALAAQRVAG